MEATGAAEDVAEATLHESAVKGRWNLDASVQAFFGGKAVGESMLEEVAEEEEHSGGDANNDSISSGESSGDDDSSGQDDDSSDMDE